jgi:hypothetical protein
LELEKVALSTIRQHTLADFKAKDRTVDKLASKTRCWIKPGINAFIGAVLTKRVQAKSVVRDPFPHVEELE